MSEPACPAEVTTSDKIQDAIVSALKGKTLAGDAIFVPRTWPAALDPLPMIKVGSPKERKDSLGPNAPQYDVLTTIRLTAIAKLKAVNNDQAAAAALVVCGILQRQIERAVINNYALYLIISEIVSVDSENGVKSEGSVYLAELTMDFVMKFYQGTEDFAPIDTVPITEVMLVADLIDVADLLGTYANDPDFPYPVEPAPREQGPDGRKEVSALIELETES